MSTYPSLEECRGQFIAALSAPGGRDKQRLVGPSEIGGCPYCLGYNMAKQIVEMPSREDRNLGLGAKMGTAFHYYLEHNLVLGGMDFKELKLKNIFEIPGYGQIGGTTDRYVASWGRTVDFKCPGKYSYEKVAEAIAKWAKAMERGELHVDDSCAPSIQHRAQQQVYRKGVQDLGHEVVGSAIISIPRHLNDYRDILFWEEPPNDPLLDNAIARSIKIWEFVSQGRLDEIPSDSDCYQCTHWQVGTRGDLTAYHRHFA